MAKEKHIDSRAVKQFLKERGLDIEFYKYMERQNGKKNRQTDA